MSIGERPIGGGPQRSAGRVELVRSWLLSWAICAAIWLVLDDTVALPELVDGAVAATIGASAATLVRARSHVQFEGRSQWLRRWWCPLGRLFLDLPALVGTLARALTGGDRDPGRVRTVEFSVPADARARAAKVALASIAGSVAPRTVVIAVDEEAGRLIFHELIPGEGRAQADPLELG